MSLDRLAGVAAAAHLLVALDFDGTLAPFADDPMAVTMVPGAAEVLDDVARRPRTDLALVSGRPVRDLAIIAAPPASTWLAGSHGAELARVESDGSVRHEDDDPTPAEAELVQRLDRALEQIAAQAGGAWVEHKTFARVLHTRRCSAVEAERVSALALSGPATWPGVHALVGKNVVELAVRTTTKGDAIAHLRSAVARRAGVPADEVAVVFAGDDVTDENAMAVLGPGDVGIKVGEGATTASVRVADEAALVALLRGFLNR